MPLQDTPTGLNWSGLVWTGLEVNQHRLAPFLTCSRFILKGLLPQLFSSGSCVSSWLQLQRNQMAPGVHVWTRSAGSAPCRAEPC